MEEVNKVEEQAPAKLMEEQVQLPSVNTVQRLYRNMNIAVGDFKEDNTNVPYSTVLMFTLHAMLSFPYEWLRSSGNEDSFVEAITAEAKVFKSLIDARKKALQDENNVVQDNTTANDNLTE